MSKNTEWTVLNKSHLSEFKKDTGIIILQNEQITKQLLYIREEITKIKKELKHLDDKYTNEYLIISGSQIIKVKELLRMINEIMDNKLEIEYFDAHIEGHYELTPYTFRPRMARKYSSRTTIDLGQGLLDTIYDVYKKLKYSENEKPIITLPDG